MGFTPEQIKGRMFKRDYYAFYGEEWKWGG